MDQQPKIPTLKDAQKPQVKIKGMGAGVTIFDRLKQFKKKDLAFILAGMGTLFMAPLAEHFMMAPENGDGQLRQGWAGNGSSGSNLFGGGSSPYESGNNSIAQGGAIGGGGDIITPLNVRDPSALVMGPGAAQQPPAGSAAPAIAPPTAPARSEEDYKDALKASASRAASAAVKKSPLPVPKVALGGSGLRGLGVAGGGTSASSSLGPVGPAAGSTGAGGGGGGLNLVRSTPGFRSAAGPRSPTGPGGLDGTKKAGQNAGDAFSRTGSALSGLNAAASEQIPTGPAGAGFGGSGLGGAGANDKGPGGSGPGGSKSVGESLAFIEAKERMMENLKLEFEKRKLKDPELLMYGIRNDVLKAMAGKVGETVTKRVTDLLNYSPEAAAKTIACPPGSTKKPLSSAQANMCSDTAKFNCYKTNSNTGEWNYQGAEGTASIACEVTTDAGTTGPPAGEVTPTTGPAALANGRELAASAPAVGNGLDLGCARLSALANPPVVAGATAASVDDQEIPHYAGMLPKAKGLVTARALLAGGGTATSCGESAPPAGTKTAVALQAEALQALKAEIPRMNEFVTKPSAGPDGNAVAVNEADVNNLALSVKNAAGLVGTSRSQIDTAKGLIDNAGEFTSYNRNETSESREAATKLTEAKAAIQSQYTSIEATQKKLEAALKKAQDTVGTDTPGGTLAEVRAQNQAFLDMKKTIDTKKTEFARTDEAWSGATVADPRAVTAGGSSEPSVVSEAATTGATSAKNQIEAVCTKIGGCTPAVAPVAGAPAADPAPAPSGDAATPPQYSEVSPLLQPATDSVSTMRQVQSNAISGLNADLTGLSAPAR